MAPGGERTVLVVFSPTLCRTQRKTMNRQQATADDRLRELAARIDGRQQSRGGKGHSEESVRRKIRGWTSREHLHDYLDLQIEVEKDRVLRLSWAWNLERKRAVQRLHLGKTTIVTDRHDWDTATIAHTCRRLTRTESLFKISKSDPGIWWPMFHWTDGKIRVHGLYCFFALLLLASGRLDREPHALPSSLTTSAVNSR